MEKIDLYEMGEAAIANIRDTFGAAELAISDNYLDIPMSDEQEKIAIAELQRFNFELSRIVERFELRISSIVD